MKGNPPALQIMAACALVSCANPTNSTNPQGGSTLSAQVFQDTNAYRSSHGTRQLKRHPGLDRLASEHCEYLRRNRGTFKLYGKNVSHNGAEGRALIAMKRLNMFSCSENVASTMSQGSDRQTSRAIVQLWQQSRDHEQAMRDSAWTHTGIGTVVAEDGRVFATQLFGTMSQSHLTMHDRLTQF
jgi:uncharacterized protein YkwD